MDEEIKIKISEAFIRVNSEKHVITPDLKKKIEKEQKIIEKYKQEYPELFL